MSNRDINVVGKMIKEYQESLKAQKNIAYGDEPSTHELLMDADGEWRVVSEEERSKHLKSMPKGTKVWNGEPIESIPNYIQSWYENRRD